MAIKKRRLLLVILMTAALFYGARPQLGCGPFFTEAVFTYSKHPDIPLDQFAAGRLGVLRPTYARSYLTVAYRYLNGGGFDQEEQKAMVALWNERLKPYWENDSEDAVKRWLDARAKVATGSAPAEIGVFRSVDNKDYSLLYYNCPQDAFRNAATTLGRIAEKFGAASPEAKEWVAAQDQVFANCSGGAAIPAAPNPASPPLVQSYRNYQIAAANFYAGNFDAAEQMFRTVAVNQASPYQPLAPYLLARTLVRKATLSGAENKVDKVALANAEAQLKRVLGDNSQTALHPAARRLMSFVRFRLAPEQRMRELSAALLKSNSGKTLWQDLWDYTLLLDQYVNDEDEVRKFEALPSVGREDDLTDWVLTYQVTDAQATDYSIGKWEKTKSLPWLISALSKVGPEHAKAAALITAADLVKQSSPGFASAAFHSSRLLIGAGKKDEARKRLDTLLSDRAAAVPPSALNLFLSLRMKVARDADEFLKYAQRVPAGFSANADGREVPEDVKGDESLKKFAGGLTVFASDSARTINEKTPLGLLKQAATNAILPAHLRRQVAQAAWVRAILLDDDASARALAITLGSLAPELKQLLDAYLAGDTPEARKYSALYLILKFPGVEPFVDAGVGRVIPLAEIDNFRDNWWCSFGERAEGAATPSKDFYEGGNPDYPNFLSEAERATAASEWKRLVSLQTAPNYLSVQALSWAAKNPTDARAPEALHLAVRSTRYGCTDDETGKFSKQAYDTLHRRYPKSSWAAKTKYWFKQ